MIRFKELSQQFCFQLKGILDISRPTPPPQTSDEILRTNLKTRNKGKRRNMKIKAKN
jgi:hypothetical protein